MYISRSIEKILPIAEKQAKVLLVTGARQVGKTTLLKETIGDRFSYVSFDDKSALHLAKTDPNLFFLQYPLPLIIDEVQYGQEFFVDIKSKVDQSSESGTLWLTGSQRYRLMSNISDSLAGRISILELPPLSSRELNGIDFHMPFVPSKEYIDARSKCLNNKKNTWDMIVKGTMPALYHDDIDREWFYRDYVATYIERDVRELLSVKDTEKFYEFLIALAGRATSLMNSSSIAKDIGISVPTVQRWLSVLDASGIIQLIRPYHNNALKIAVKTPKVFFMDTGLLCYLLGWNTAETAMKGPMSGMLFENYVVSEVVKSFLNSGTDTRNIFFYRDTNGKEIDLIICDNKKAYPVEIKKGATVQEKWARPIESMYGIKGLDMQEGFVIYQGSEPMYISEKVRALPVEYI